MQWLCKSGEGPNTYARNNKRTVGRSVLCSVRAELSQTARVSRWLIWVGGRMLEASRPALGRGEHFLRHSRLWVVRIEEPSKLSYLSKSLPYELNNNNNSVAFVREQTTATERPSLVAVVSANFSG
jgi:hypothetical protein